MSWATIFGRLFGHFVLDSLRCFETPVDINVDKGTCLDARNR